MSQPHIAALSRVKFILTAGLVFLVSNLYSQTYVPGIIGKNFIAVTVTNADSAATWYENVFGIKLLKEIKANDGSVHIRIEGNDFLMVEIVQARDSRNLGDCRLQKDESHLMQGFFKAGLFVEDIEKAEKYFKAKAIAIRHGVFNDKETATRAIILEDPNGNMLQFLQDVGTGRK